MKLFAEIEKSIERGFRKWTERVLGPAEASELLLVHRAILEEIEGRVETLAGGQRVFPYSRVIVTLVAADAERWLEKPVLAMSVVTYWDALRRCGIDDRLYGCGRILEEF